MLVGNMKDDFVADLRLSPAVKPYQQGYICQSSTGQQVACFLSVCPYVTQSLAWLNISTSQLHHRSHTKQRDKISTSSNWH